MNATQADAPRVTFSGVVLEMPGAPEAVIQLIVVGGSAVVGGTVIERLIGRG